jgi:hypothetical protein
MNVFLANPNELMAAATRRTLASDDREVYLDALGENKNHLPLPQEQGLGEMTKESWFDSWQMP